MILSQASKIVIGQDKDPYYNNVSLLTHMDGTNGSQTFIDSSANNFSLTTVGNAQISTTVQKFGNASGYFDGVNSYIEAPLNSAFDFGTGDFTIELWAYPTRTGGHVCVSRWKTGSDCAYYLAIDTTSGIVLYLNNAFITNGGTITTNQWYHIAVTRQGSSIKAFLNGVQVGSTYNIGTTAIFSSTVNLRIGRDYITNPPFEGYMDDVRITKGVARYTSNFSSNLPNEAFADQSNPNTVKSVYLGKKLTYFSPVDSNAATYIQNVEAADSLALGYTSTLEWEVKKAINDFVVGCKADSIWNSLSSCCILMGARTLSGALVPLVGTAPTSYNFVSTDYSRTLGLKGGPSGSAKYLDSNRLNSIDPKNNAHASAYVFTADNGIVLGSSNDSGVGGEIGMRPYNAATTNFFRAHDSAGPYPVFSPTPTAPGFIGTSRNDPNLLNYIYPGVNLISYSAGSTTVFVPNNIYVFRRSSNTNPVYFAGRIGFYSLGPYVNLTLLKNRVNTLVTSITASI